MDLRVFIVVLASVLCSFPPVSTQRGEKKLENGHFQKNILFISEREGELEWEEGQKETPC